MAKKRYHAKSISGERALYKISDLAFICYNMGKDHADDEGRIEADPATFRATVMPFTKHSVEEVAEALQELQSVKDALGIPYVLVYNVHGISVMAYEKVRWRDEQGKVKNRSILPPPPEEDPLAEKFAELDRADREYATQSVRRVVDERLLNPRRSTQYLCNVWNEKNMKPRASWSERLVESAIHERLKQGYTELEMQHAIENLRRCQENPRIVFKYKSIPIETFLRFSLHYFVTSFEEALEICIMPYFNKKR